MTRVGRAVDGWDDRPGLSLRSGRGRWPRGGNSQRATDVPRAKLTLVGHYFG